MVMAEIDREEKAKLAALHQANVETQAKYYPVITGQANASRAAETSRYGANVGKVNIAEADRRQDEADRAKGQLLEAKLGTLRDEGAMGDELAEKEAQRLESLAEVQAKQAEITKQLREQKDLTADARRDLENALAGQQQREKDLQGQATANRQNAVLKDRIELCNRWARLATDKPTSKPIKLKSR